MKKITLLCIRAVSKGPVSFMLQGLIMLTVQARLPSLKPPKCTPGNPNSPCQEVSGGKAGLLFIGLYMVALGVGGIKGSLATHGAEQFDEGTPQGRKQRSTFFNFFVFSLACGGLIAVTLVVWIEDNKGWEWGFGISTISILLSIPAFLAGSTLYRNKIPCGSPLTTILKVTNDRVELLRNLHIYIWYMFQLLSHLVCTVGIGRCLSEQMYNQESKQCRCEHDSKPFFSQ